MQSYNRTLVYSLLACTMVAAAVWLYIFAVVKPAAEVNPDAALAALGVSLGGETANFDMKCDATALPANASDEQRWSTVCETGYSSEYTGIYWKRPDLQKLSFQNSVIDRFLARASADPQQPLTGTFTCEASDSLEDDEGMRIAMVTCATVVGTVSTTTAYTTFIYGYPANLDLLNAVPVVVVSSGFKQSTDDRAAQIFKSLRPAAEAQSISLLRMFAQTVHAQGDPGAATGDGTGTGTGDGTGDPASGAVGDCHLWPNDLCGGYYYPYIPPAPTPVTCTWSVADYTESVNDCKTTVTYTNVQSCSDGTVNYYPGNSYTTGTSCPVVTDWCASVDASQYCTTDSCTTNSGVVRYGTKDCSCTNGASDYPTCTPPVPKTCANGASDYPTCTPTSTPTPTPTPVPTPTPAPTTCTDPNANNYGGGGACNYDSVPRLSASISGSRAESAPGGGFNLTWGSELATSCTVTYTGPDGGGTISTGPTRGEKGVAFTLLGTYRLTNTCTDGSGTAQAYMDHNVVQPDLTAGTVTPTTAYVYQNYRVAGPNAFTQFKATVSNIGTGSTGEGWFYNFMQVAAGTNGGGTITDLGNENRVNDMRAGGSQEIYGDHYFTTPGTYSVRACADKLSRGDLGNITESDENNNCGLWTNICVVTNQGSPVDCSLPATATLSASPSSIRPGKSSKLTWSSTGATSCTAAGGFSTNDQTSGTVSVSPLTTSTYSITCTGAGGTSDPAFATVTVTTPELSISAVPSRVLRGGSATVSWTATGVKSCSITRNGAAWKSGLQANGNDTVSGSSADTITAQTTYVFSCTDVEGNAFSTVDSVIVNLSPGFQEF